MRRTLSSWCQWTVSPEFEDHAPMRHTQVTMIANATQPVSRATSFSPVTCAFHHSTRPHQLVRANAPRRQALSDQGRYRRSGSGVAGSSPAAGSSSGFECVRVGAQNFSHGVGEFRHSTDLFRQRVLTRGWSGAYATPPHGYPEQARRKPVPRVCRQLAPPRAPPRGCIATPDS
jgi:hypothetical protein